MKQICLAIKILMLSSLGWVLICTFIFYKPNIHYNNVFLCESISIMCIYFTARPGYETEINSCFSLGYMDKPSICDQICSPGSDIANLCSCYNGFIWNVFESKCECKNLLEPPWKTHVFIYGCLFVYWTKKYAMYSKMDKNLQGQKS